MRLIKNAFALLALMLGISVLPTPVSCQRLPRNDPMLANMTSIICKPPTYGWAPTLSLLQGVKYLQEKEGYTEFGWQHGGGFCTRVSCEEDSGIYVCNDNAHPIWVDYAVMASYAQYVLDYDDAGDQTACTWVQSNVENSGMKMHVAWAQVFDSRGFNVVVGIKQGTNC